MQGMHCSPGWSWLCISPVLKSANLEFDNYQSIFVWHFAYQSIPTTNVLAKYRSFLWNWTPSHIQRIYKGQNSENPLRAITFDWSVLRTWGWRLCATFLMLFSGIPHLPTFCHVGCVTYITQRVSRASRMSRMSQVIEQEEERKPREDTCNSGRCQSSNLCQYSGLGMETNTKENGQFITTKSKL